MQIIDLNFLGINATVAAFLLPTDAGLALIETGPHSTLPQLQAAIQQAGYRAEDVRHIFLSHIHLDHAGAAWWFAQQGATIYVHPKGLAHLAEPGKLMASARMIYGDDMDRLWGEMHPISPERLTAVEHGQEIDLGNNRLQAWHTPGHAVHHIAWQWGKNLFTGDVAGVKIGPGPVAPPCPPPDIHVGDWLSSIQLMRELPIDTLYLTHFGPIAAIEDHLNALADELNAWAGWMKPHYLAGHAPEAVTPLFQAFVKERLETKGLDAHGLAQYEAANPSWMSVAGLLRYWKKTLG